MVDKRPCTFGGRTRLSGTGIIRDAWDFPMLDQMMPIERIASLEL